MMRTIFLIISLSLLISSCTSRPADLIPDKNPLVAISSINGKDTRQAGINKTKIFAPGAVLGSTLVEVTASDDTFIGKVELLLNGESVKVLDANKDKKVYNNPFAFDVDFEGTGAKNTAILRAIATDNSNKESIYETEVIVDNTPPVVEITSITGLEGGVADSFTGTIVISGQAFDPESGIAIDAFEGAEVRAYLDGDLNNALNLAGDTKTPQTSFSASVKGLEDGVHYVTMYARNGANVFAGTTKLFTMKKPDTTPAP
jgi:hypothetical protein